MSKNFIIDLVVYPFEVMVSIGESDEQLWKVLKRTLTDEEFEDAKFKDENCRGRAILYENNTTLIRLPKLPKTNEDYGSLQHEIFHAVTFLMDRIGMKLEILKSDEAYAYLVGYLTQKIYDKL